MSRYERTRNSWAGPECTCPNVLCELHDEPVCYPDNLDEPEWIETWMLLVPSDR